jgi:hypothetical protein
MRNLFGMPLYNLALSMSWILSPPAMAAKVSLLHAGELTFSDCYDFHISLHNTKATVVETCGCSNLSSGTSFHCARIDWEGDSERVAFYDKPNCQRSESKDKVYIKGRKGDNQTFTCGKNTLEAMSVKIDSTLCWD